MARAVMLFGAANPRGVVHLARVQLLLDAAAGNQRARLQQTTTPPAHAS